MRDSRPDAVPSDVAECLEAADDATLQAVQTYITTLLAANSTPQQVTPEELPPEAVPVADEHGEDEVRGMIAERNGICGDPSCGCMNGSEKHETQRYRYYYAYGTLQAEPLSEG